jgi:hypothetical protein
VKRIAMSTMGCEVNPAGCESNPAGFKRLLAPRVHKGPDIFTTDFQEPAMTTEFDTINDDLLTIPSGGISAAANWVMMHESGGSTTAGHLYAQGRGDGTPGNHSSAFGAFQMIQSTRKQYMGADYQSTDFSKQYAAATKYVNSRYGGWDGAKSFWQGHHWY